MVLKENIWYEPAGEERTLHIYLPEDYERTQKRYPVMYFWDGHNLFNDSDATYGKSWGLGSFLDNWRKDMIIAGIECSHKGNHRLDEYCPYDARMMDIPIHGEGRETLDWMTGTLKSYIDSRFRTDPSREATAIGGSSMGGLMSLYAVTMYNSVFSKAACLSSTVFIVMARLISDIQDCFLNKDTRVYLSWGENEGGTDPNADFNRHLREANQRMAELLWERGIAARLYCQPEGGHSEAFWEKQIPIFMDYLWGR